MATRSEKATDNGDSGEKIQKNEQSQTAEGSLRMRDIFLCLVLVAVLTTGCVSYGFWKGARRAEKWCIEEAVPKVKKSMMQGFSHHQQGEMGERSDQEEIGSVWD